MSNEIYFSSNYRDLCEQHGTGAGFQFEFYCSRCSDTWRAPFEVFTAGRAASWLGKGVSTVSSMLGGNGGTITNAADGLVGATWGSSRDAAFQRAITQAQGHFKRCARCTSYVCERCFSPSVGLCHGCAPDTAAEAEAARQRGVNAMVEERAYDAGQQAGRTYDVATPKQLVCPQCSHETHGTAFCGSCGYRLAQPSSCTSCHAEVPDGSAFCPTCGMRR